MAFTMFVFFGFNDEAVDSYRRGLVQCGAGRIWPSLKLSREQRWESSSGGSNGRGSATGSSRWSSLGSHLDLVSKAMKYLDGDKRKGSSSASTAVGTDA